MRDVESFAACGRISEAVELAHRFEAQPWLPSAIRGELRLTLSSILLMSGQPDDAIAEAEAVLAEPGLSEKLYTEAELSLLLAC